mgnify:CR=1 FL=1|tara:strand:- start:362 stop:766 length:405 start_codon:yes stop_codon:yes gene_type:complete
MDNCEDIRKVVRITFADRVKLLDYIRSQWDSIEADKPTVEEFAKKASSALGIDRLTKNHVKGVCKLIKKRWPVNRGKGTKTNSPIKGQTHMVLVQRITTLEKQVKFLLGELGIEINAQSDLDLLLASQDMKKPE